MYLPLSFFLVLEGGGRSMVLMTRSSLPGASLVLRLTSLSEAGRFALDNAPSMSGSAASNLLRTSALASVLLSCVLSASCVCVCRVWRCVQVVAWSSLAWCVARRLPPSYARQAGRRGP